MYPSSLLATVAFVLAVGGLVALVDRWREARANRRLRMITGGRATAPTAGAARPRPQDRRAA